MSQTADFYNALFAERLGSDEYAHLRIIKNNTVTHQDWVQYVTDWEDAIEKYGKNANVYFGVNPREYDGTDKSTVTHINVLHADMDFKHFANDKELAYRTLDGFELPPQVVVNTGGGLHVYWKLEPRLEASPANIAHAEKLMERLYYRLGGLDKVQDVSRILRVPGTLNVKKEYPEPLPVTLERSSDLAGYTLEQFDNVLPWLPEEVFHSHDDIERTFLAPSEREIAELLAVLPANGWEYRMYNSILMAVHSVFPDERGVRLIQAWSPPLSDTGEDITASKWRSYRSKGISVGTLYKLALDHGWKPRTGPKIRIVRDGLPSPRRELDEILTPPWKQKLNEMEEVLPEELPSVLHQLSSYIAPVGQAFTSDATVLLPLAFWSSQWPRLKFENQPLSLYLMFLGPQGVGKTIMLDEFTKIFREVARERDMDMPLFTSGTTRGLENMFKGDDKMVLAVIDEFSGFLKATKSEYSAGVKESMNKIYDSSSLSHRKATESIEAERPFMSMIAATTPEAWRMNASVEDTNSGFLTRFLFLAPNVSNLSPHYRYNDDSRKPMVDLLVAQGREYSHISSVNWDTTFGQEPDILKSYMHMLGLNTGELRDLDKEVGQQGGLSWQRVVARVKRVAALLALAEEKPDVVGHTLLVHDRHVALAIRIAHRGAAYHMRSLAWLSHTQDEAAVSKVEELLKKHRQMTSRQIQQLSHLPATKVYLSLGLLEDDGKLSKEKKGKADVYCYTGGL